MITVADLAPLLGHNGVRDTVERYLDCRWAIARGRPLEQAIATDGLDVCRHMIGPAVAVAEGAVTEAEMTRRIAETDVTKRAQWTAQMRWVEHHRDPDAPTLDDVLAALSVELGLGEPTPWPPAGS